MKACFRVIIDCKCGIICHEISIENGVNTKQPVELVISKSMS